MRSGMFTDTPLALPWQIPRLQTDSARWTVHAAERAMLDPASACSQRRPPGLLLGGLHLPQRVQTWLHSAAEGTGSLVCLLTQALCQGPRRARAPARAPAGGAR